MKESENNMQKGTAVGVLIGSLLGLLTDNPGLWISLGIAIGAAVGTYFNQQAENAE